MTIRTDTEILDTVASLTDRHGYPPTVRELAAELGLSVGNMHTRLVALRRGGRVSWRDNQPRTLRCVIAGDS